MPNHSIPSRFALTAFTVMWLLVFNRCLLVADVTEVTSLNQTLPDGNVTGITSALNNTWDYSDSNKWPILIAPCGGEHQSPINIDPTKAVVTDYPRMSFVNYDRVFPETITNNGHTVTLQIHKNDGNDSRDLPYIEDGGLSDRYIFYQLHFHWGGNDRRGSEHRISHRGYPAELHIVHYGRKYDNFTEASKHPDGLAVLAILIEIEMRDNIAFRHIEHFDEITRPANPSNIGDSNVTNLTNPVALDDLLPDNCHSFYRYNGSLTTPSCSESVIWTIFDTPIALSERQMKEFRKLFNTEGQHLTDNFRPVQSLHGRLVMYRFEI